MKAEFKIGETRVGEAYPPYFIADIAANHDGNLERALRLIELAKEAGAHAAKFQNFKANKIVSRHGFENLGGKLSHQSSWKKTVYEVYEDASISQNWTHTLKDHCRKVGIEYFTSPYDFESVDHVDPFVEVYKIGSGDITWLEMVEYIGRKGKPVLLATGASTLEDVDRAVAVLRNSAKAFSIMQCNTNYTMDADKSRFVNLNVLREFAFRYPDAVLGLSDHTLGVATVVASIPLGARLIEKHFTDDNLRDGPDHKFAMNPKNWRMMIDLSNEAFVALGDGKKRVEENETQASVVQRRCLRATHDITEGTLLKKEDLEPLRPAPADSFAPYLAKELTGRRLKIAIRAGEHFTEKYF